MTLFFSTVVTRLSKDEWNVIAAIIELVPHSKGLAKSMAACPCLLMALMKAGIAGKPVTYVLGIVVGVKRSKLDAVPVHNRWEHR